MSLLFISINVFWFLCAFKENARVVELWIIHLCEIKLEFVETVELSSHPKSSIVVHHANSTGLVLFTVCNRY
ncbi:hypothetical protein L6452_32857 [Arctium lappa]|uniref:Uncharacterized protein n=1 Tax=Arctium lappa TaxID=4217 RepID=A0ACB8Z4W6_ARCLA|nr:hypothetical protein L6452_32857 [Arctium lappa]